jgi:hypothetical protein
VGTTSFTWVNWGRGVSSGAMRAGQDTTIGVRVPPQSAAISLV